jgi:hypothetical protein
MADEGTREYDVWLWGELMRALLSRTEERLREPSHDATTWKNIKAEMNAAYIAIVSIG